MCVAPPVAELHDLLLDIVDGVGQRRGKIRVSAFSDQRMIVQLHDDLCLMKVPLDMMRDMSLAFAALLNHLAQFGKLHSNLFLQLRSKFFRLTRIGQLHRTSKDQHMTMMLNRM